MNNRTLSEIVVENVCAFRDRLGWSTRELARKSGVSDKMVWKVVNGESAPTTHTIEKLAKAFGIQSWELMIPGIKPDLLDGAHLYEIQSCYLSADEEGRRMMETAAEYVSSHKKSADNDPNAPKEGQGQKAS
ncbi:MAG: helix-turn-helix transcriptional regulator [Roseovarius sp.]|nr:helix-turn-helix transcriptional regulator [Roseovarius sp.]